MASFFWYRLQGSFIVTHPTIMVRLDGQVESPGSEITKTNASVNELTSKYIPLFDSANSNTGPSRTGHCPWYSPSFDADTELSSLPGEGEPLVDAGLLDVGVQQSFTVWTFTLRGSEGHFIFTLSCTLPLAERILEP